jgi:hypothetical protein
MYGAMLLTMLESSSIEPNARGFLKQAKTFGFKALKPKVL